MRRALVYSVAAAIGNGEVHRNADLLGVIAPACQNRRRRIERQIGHTEIFPAKWLPGIARTCDSKQGFAYALRDVNGGGVSRLRKEPQTAPAQPAGRFPRADSAREDVRAG